MDYSEFKLSHDSLEAAANFLFDIEEDIANYKIFYRLTALSLKNGKINDALNVLARALYENKKELHLLTDYYPEALSFDEVNTLIEQFK